MHEATITIKKLWPPYQTGDKRTNLEDLEGNKYRIDVAYGAGFHDGDVVEIGYSDEKLSEALGGREYKLIKQMKRVSTKGGFLNDLARGNGQAAPRPADIGPHAGMWEKVVSDLIVGGMFPEAIPAHIILCRQLAREGLRADIDGKLPEAKAEFNDSLEF